MKFLLNFNVLLLVVFVACKKVEYEKVATDKEIGASVTFRNFIRESFDENGVMSYHLKAEESYVFAEPEKTILYNFEFDQYEKGVYNSHLTCQRGDLDHSTKLLKLNGDIKLTNVENRTLYTEELAYNLDEKTLSTDAKVYLYLNGTTISGKGLRSDNELKKVIVLHPDAITSGNPFKEKVKK